MDLENAPVILPDKPAEEYKEIFVGFEYKGTEDQGLFGLKIGAFDEDLTDDYLKDLFKELTIVER